MILACGVPVYPLVVPLTAQFDYSFSLPRFAFSLPCSPVSQSALRVLPSVAIPRNYWFFYQNVSQDDSAFLELQLSIFIGYFTRISFLWRSHLVFQFISSSCGHIAFKIKRYPIGPNSLLLSKLNLHFLLFSVIFGLFSEIRFAVSLPFSSYGQRKDKRAATRSLRYSIGPHARRSALSSC